VGGGGGVHAQPGVLNRTLQHCAYLAHHGSGVEATNISQLFIEHRFFTVLLSSAAELYTATTQWDKHCRSCKR